MSLGFSLYVYADLGGEYPYYVDLYSRNYTHNVTPMWIKVGVYDALYMRADKQASEIIEVLKAGVLDMQTKPDEYKLLNPPNGWGDYDSALVFLEDVLSNCEKYPKAIIGVSK